MRFAPILLVCLCLFACHSSPVQQTEIDLIREISLAEQQPDTALISFGTEEGKAHLVDGWSTPERDHGNPFQWAISREPSFAFSAQTQRRPLNLYLVMKSFFTNPANVYVNDRYLSRIIVGDETSKRFLPLPANYVNADKNVVKLQFAELRSPQNGKDTRELAAAAYLAVVTPSRYIGQTPHTTRFIEGSAVRIRNKVYPGVSFQTGGAINYFEKLNHSSVLKFGYHFRPASFAENDDYARFRVTLQKDGSAEKEIFSRRLQQAHDEFFSIPLSTYVSGSADIYQLRFEVERNSIFNDAETSWIQPVLQMEHAVPPNDSSSREAITLQEQNQNANVLLIVLDAGGAGHFHCYGYNRNTTPVIDQLARQGVQFHSAYSNAAYTLASTASLMTGLYPEHHRVLSMRDKLPESTITLADVLRMNGYRTATFVANGNASSTFGMTQGFQKVAEVFRMPNYSGWAKDITHHFVDWLDENHDAKFFAYLHYREPHDPYNPPEEWVRKFVDPNYKGNIGKTFYARIKINTNDPGLSEADRKQIRDLYDANLAYGDSQVGVVLAALKKAGVYDNTIVIVTADHGEAFWQHGYQGHNTQVYQESIHIPLIMKLKANQLSGKKIEQRVRTIDMYPTLLDVLGLRPRNLALDGQSFLSYLISSADQKRKIFAQTTRERQYTYRDEDYKFIDDVIFNVQELYDLRSDPQEKQNLLASQTIRAKYFRSKLLSYIETNRALAGIRKTERAIIDEVARENLKALGYIDQ